MYHACIGYSIPSTESDSLCSSWKIAKLTPIFKKDDATEIGNYRLISLLSISSKMLESEVNDSLVHHVFKEHGLASDRQWAYRQACSTEPLLVHLTETWRKAVDSGLTVAVAFADFRTAFDSVSHSVLMEKLRKNFGICDQALDWITGYLNGRNQYTVVNGNITLTPCLYPSGYHRDRCSALNCSLYLPTICRQV